jgi:glycosyltransferase involved in cell wall biosynthesis
MTGCTNVILPVRNGARYVAEAIRSVLVQLDEDDELIVIDDASSDNTMSVIAAIADARVRVLSSPGCGVSKARNIGLAAARGEFIAFLDHDDLWPAGRHAPMLRMLREHPDIHAVFGRIRLLFAEGVVPLPRFMEMDGTFLVESVPTGLFRRGLLDRIDGFAEDMLFAEDSDFCSRLIEAGMHVGYCDVDGLIYRRHDSNATNDRRAAQAGFFDMLRRKVARATQSKPS